jgi:hypothetical protein
MRELNEYEQAFVDAICEYKPPIIDYSIIALSNSEELSGKLKSIKDEEQRKEINRAEKDTKDIISCLETAVNNFSVNIEGMISAIKNDKKGYENLISLSYEWVGVWNEAPAWRTDGRNEISTRLCKEIASVIITHDGSDEILKSTYFPSLNAAITGMHRTLIQTSTNLFLNVLKKEDRSVNNLLKKQYGDKEIELPLI